MKKILPLLFIALFAFASQYAHAQQERLISFCTYSLPQLGVTYLAQDSLVYRYSGSRAIDSAWGANPAYDTCYRWTFTAGAYQPQVRYIETFGANGHVSSDTVWNWNTVTQSFDYNYFQLKSYTANNLAERSDFYQRDITNDKWFLQRSGFKYYNSGNYQIYDIGINWDTTTMTYTDTASYNAETRDSHGNVTADTLLSKNGSNWDIYIGSFDSAGNETIQLNQHKFLPRDSNVWRNSSKTFYTYDASGYLFTDTLLAPDSTGWHNVQIQNFTYDLHHNLTGWITLTADSSGRWSPFKKTIRTFDSYDMITSSRIVTADTSGAWAPAPGDGWSLYHYELVPVSGIAGISTGDARIYPVPAADMLSLDLTWPDAHASTVTIYDMTGRSYYSATLPCTASYHGYIPLHGLPAGLYTLRVEGANGAITRTFNIVK